MRHCVLLPGVQSVSVTNGRLTTGVCSTPQSSTTGITFPPVGGFASVGPPDAQVEEPEPDPALAPLVVLPPEPAAPAEPDVFEAFDAFEEPAAPEAPVVPAVEDAPEADPMLLPEDAPLPDPFGDPVVSADPLPVLVLPPTVVPLPFAGVPLEPPAAAVGFDAAEPEPPPPQAASSVTVVSISTSHRMPNPNRLVIRGLDTMHRRGELPWSSSSTTVA